MPLRFFFPYDIETNNHLSNTNIFPQIQDFGFTYVWRRLVTELRFFMVLVIKIRLQFNFGT